MAAPHLSAVPSHIPDPPYPADTRIRGWRFELDHERIEASDTWALAPADMRPWLLMIWWTGWKQRPAGSLPNDDQLIAARVGMDLRQFRAHRDILLRGWVLHSDGRLYHRVISEQVLGYLGKREKEAARKAAWREKQGLEENVPRDRHGTDGGRTLPVPVPVPVPDEDKETALSPPAEAGADLVLVSDCPSCPPCPHAKIIDAYARILPELPRPIFKRWVGSGSAKELQARWREDQQHQCAEFWEAFFSTVRRNPHWMGGNERQWKADLHWFVKRANFDKVLTRMVNTGA